MLVVVVDDIDIMVESNWPVLVVNPPGVWRNFPIRPRKTPTP